LNKIVNSMMKQSSPLPAAAWPSGDLHAQSQLPPPALPALFAAAATLHPPLFFAAGRQQLLLFAQQRRRCLPHMPA
jgi:hypothetical protein